MAKRKSKKDQVEWVDLVDLIPESLPEREDYRGAQLGLKRVDPSLAREWALRQRLIFLENKRRRIEKNEQAQAEIYDEDELTNETIQETVKLQTEILEACVAGMKEIEGIGEDDARGALDEIEFIGIRAEVSELAESIQSLSARQRFRVSRAGGSGDAAGPAGAH